MSNYLIIGGTSGIGLSITQKLAAQGNQVTVISRGRSDFEPIQNVTYHELNILDDNLEALQFDELNGLVYCPGSINLRPFRTLKSQDFINDFSVNVVGAVRVIQQVEKALKKSNQGSIVLFSTVAVSQGMPYHASTAAAKGAVEGLMRSLAAEFAPAVRVNAIAPSITDTPMANGLLSTEEKQKKSAERHPLKSIGQPEDIASAAIFLLSEDSKWVTGQVLGIDGGMSTIRPLQ